MKLLDKMASEVVGDGKSPNLYFVTFVQFEDRPVDESWGTIAVFSDPDMARDFAESLGNHRAVLVEDRLNGEVWTNRTYDRMQGIIED
jgi:hypothetical protein